MLASVSRIISRSRLPASLIQQQRSLGSSKKGDSTSPSTGDTYENNKKDIHKPTIDASHQLGPQSQEERSTWENKEQGLTADTETRQERIPKNEKKPKSSKK